MQGQFKLSQNKSAADRRSVIEQLKARGKHDLARDMTDLTES